jgi:hypothetical protein
VTVAAARIRAGRTAIASRDEVDRELSSALACIARQRLQAPGLSYTRQQGSSAVAGAVSFICFGTKESRSDRLKIDALPYPHIAVVHGGKCSGPISVPLC